MRAVTPDVPTTDQIFGFVEDLVALGARTTGSEEGRAAADYVVGRFREFGLVEAELETVQSLSWEVDRWGLEVDGAEVACFPVTHSFAGGAGPEEFSTGPDGLVAPIVDIGTVWAGDVDPETLRGAIVVFDLQFPAVDAALILRDTPLPEATLELLRAEQPLRNPYISNLLATVNVLVEAGAVGFAGVLADYFDSNRYVNENYGPMPIPGVWVTRREGAALRRRLAPEAVATLRLDGRVRSVPGYTAIGVLPGRSAETILIHSHHDSVWDGAVEDASGCAVVLALAQYFASVPAEARERTLMFVTFDTHFTGYEAHEQFVERYVRRSPGGREILVDVVPEHVARKGTIVDGELVLGDEPELRMIFHNTGPDVVQAIEDAVARNDLQRLAVLPTSILPGDELPTDADLNYEAGVPVVSLISGPMYLYDEADTIETVDRSQLRPVTCAFAEIVAALDGMPRATIAG